MEKPSPHDTNNFSDELTYHVEGDVKFLIKHVTESNGGLDEETVFYNPVQVFNRDLSMLAIYEFSKMKAEENPSHFKGLRFYDALSASG
jgi:tRNA G26 N,N-dimethylase Trm1